MAKTNIPAQNKGDMKNLAAMIKVSERNGIMDAKDGTIRHRGGAVGRVIADVQDAWANVLTGLGTFKDKRMANVATWGLALTESVAEELFAGDSIARRIVELLPNEALTKDLEWDDEIASEPLIEEMKRLQWKTKSREAWIYARLYGGGGILMNDGVTPIKELHRPLADGAKIDSLVALTRWELWQYSTEMQRDITKPDYGHAIKYRMYPRQTFGETAYEIHASRLIRFDGRFLPRLLHIRNNFWGDSVLTATMDALGDFNAAAGNVANAMHDFRQLVHKIEGLQNLVNAGKAKNVLQRFGIMDRIRSVLGAWVIDAKDDVVTQSGSLAGIEEAWSVIKEKLQAATDMPHNKIFNEGPGQKGGLGGKGGANEEDNWHAIVESKQETYHRPRTEQLIGVICGYMPDLGTVEDHKFEYATLGQPDAGQEAETYSKQAAGDQIYMDMGVRSAQAIQKARFPEEFEETPASPKLLDPAKQAEADMDMAATKAKAAGGAQPGKKGAPAAKPKGEAGE